MALWWPGNMPARLARGALVALAIATAGNFVGVGVGIGGAFELVGSAAAQTQGRVPGAAIGGSSDSETWRAIRRGQRGAVSILDKSAGVMIQSEGENWRAARNGPVSVYGAWLLGGTLVVLALFFAIRGRIRIEAGFSGRLIRRFNNIERFAHWLTASSFVVLGLTGLNMLYGRYVISPWLGHEAFSTMSGWLKYTHDYIGFAFIAGIAMILVIWIRDNIPNRLDLVWLAKGGGLFMRGVHPPARKFNAGQKIIFWLTILAGASLSYSGLSLLFPFSMAPFGLTFEIINFFGFDLPTDLTAMQEMQLTQLWHAILSLVMIAVILAHIYIGWIGMEGAYDAMGNGLVDENWAREHHSQWVAEMEIGIQPGPPPTQTDD